MMEDGFQEGYKMGLWMDYGARVLMTALRKRGGKGSSLSTEGWKRKCIS
jgi:hypothetical protein